MMLHTETPSTTTTGLAEAAAQHVAKTLHAEVALSPWPEARGLPRFLAAAYAFTRATVGGEQTLWMLSDEPVTPAVLRTHLAQVTSAWPGTIVAVFPELSWHQRNRLVEAGLAFVVPGAQVYLPGLGIDLRERSRKAAPARERLRPSAQLALLWLLYEPPAASRTSTDLAEKLGFTRMTASRAIGELHAAGAIEAETVNRTRTVRLAATPAETWRAMAARLYSPVVRRAFAPATAVATAPEAGLGALSRYSNIAEPDEPVRAVTVAQIAGVETKEPTHADTVPIEVWSYDPLLLAQPHAGAPLVDPLSLHLSLRDDPDERVQQALAAMLEEGGW